MGTAARAAVVGAAANAAADVTAQVFQNKPVSLTEAGIAAGYGAVSGGAAPLPGYWSIVISGLAGGAQQITTDTIVNGQTLGQALNVNTAIASGLGVAGALAQGSLPGSLKYAASNGQELSVATGKDALAYGGEWFANNTNAQLVNKQVNYLAGPRYISGFFIGYLPVNTGSNVQPVHPVQGP